MKTDFPKGNVFISWEPIVFLQEIRAKNNREIAIKGELLTRKSRDPFFREARFSEILPNSWELSHLPESEQKPSPSFLYPFDALTSDHVI